MGRAEGAVPDAGAGHTEWMHDDHPTFLGLMATITAWLEQYL